MQSSLQLNRQRNRDFQEVWKAFDQIKAVYGDDKTIPVFFQLESTAQHITPPPGLEKEIRNLRQRGWWGNAEVTKLGFSFLVDRKDIDIIAPLTGRIFEIRYDNNPDYNSAVAQ